jgi:hypothetical protein
VKELAAKRPDWNYRFIAGDHNACLISPPMMNTKDRSAFQKELAANPAQALTLKSGVPVPEVMPQMVDLFSAEAHTLVVVAPQPPSWLPREVTEWMTRDVALGERKPRGLREQFRVRAGDADAIHEIAEWIRLGHLHIAIVPDDPGQAQSKQAGAKQTAPQKPPSPVTPPQASSPILLRHGVEDILTGQKPLESPEQLIDQLRPALVEYRGKATASVSELQRLASGPYTAELEITVDDVSFWTREVPILDRAIRNWSPQLLQHYKIYIPMVSGGILLLILLVEGVRKKGLFDHDFPQKSRNCIFACAAATFAIASNLTTNTTSRLQYVACCAALISGGVLAMVGVIYWVAYESRRKTSEKMPALSENNG